MDYYLQMKTQKHRKIQPPIQAFLLTTILGSKKSFSGRCQMVPARIYQRDVTDTFTKSRGIVERIALIVPSRLSQIRTTNHIQSARSNSDLVECLTVKLWHPWFHSLAGAHFGSPHPAPGLLQHILCRAVVPQTLELKRNRKFII